jgi:UDP-N-acetylmuramoylalanine--D-glutamate ligase
LNEPGAGRDTGFAGARVTVMGLGLHGGGVATARYLAERGADITITDLRDEGELRESLEQLDDLSCRAVLGRHEEEDFASADFVVKNPAVPRHSPYLDKAARIETDISLFLRANTNPLICVTGTKGKSSTAAAIAHVLEHLDRKPFLGGNITRSPLTFVDRLTGSEPVVLELSSFQLGDLALAGVPPGELLPVFRPHVAAITNILPDHMNYYASMEEYVQDKALLIAGQSREDYAVLNGDDSYTAHFLHRGNGQRRFVRRHTQAASDAPGPLDHRNSVEVGASIDAEGRILLRLAGREDVVLDTIPRVPGAHMRSNLAFAALCLASYGVPAADIARHLADFPGIPHRLEHVAQRHGVRFINDSAATIPEASLQAVSACHGPVQWIAGGSDKRLRFELFPEIAREAAAVFLLAGNATGRIAEALDAAGVGYFGPYESLREAVEAAFRAARPGHGGAGAGDGAAGGAGGGTVLLSPGCASFGMFRNEFDRGQQFKEIVRRL